MSLLRQLSSRVLDESPLLDLGSAPTSCHNKQLLVTNSPGFPRSLKPHLFSPVSVKDMSLKPTGVIQPELNYNLSFLSP